jgi:hypothetical protein
VTRLRHLSAAVIFLAACLLGSLAIAKAVGIHASEPAPLACMSSEDKERVRAIAFVAFDEALKMHLEHLFDNWMRDQDPYPTRAQVGLRAGISAYLRARASASSWNPPLCDKQ